MRRRAYGRDTRRASERPTQDVNGHRTARGAGVVVARMDRALHLMSHNLYYVKLLIGLSESITDRFSAHRVPRRSPPVRTRSEALPLGGAMATSRNEKRREKRREDSSASYWHCIGFCLNNIRHPALSLAADGHRASAARAGIKACRDAADTRHMPC